MVATKPVVLMVEDDDDAAELAAIALADVSTRHEPVRVRNGQAALQFLRDVPTTGARPALVLLDLKLPGMDGVAVLRAARTLPAARFLPICMLSTSAEHADVARCYGHHANSYLQKPMAMGDLREQLALALFYWCELNVAPGVEEPARRARRRGSEGVGAAVRVAHAFTLDRPLATTRERTAALERGDRAPLLVLDSDPASRERTVEALAEVVGPTPTIGAGSIEEAESALRTAKDDPGRSPWTFPRLVVVDIDRHPEEGAAMLKQIRSLVDHRLPAIFFTGRDEPDFVERCYALGPNSVVRKPEGLDDYRDTVHLIGHYWLRLNRTVPYGAVPMPEASKVSEDA